MTRGKPASVSGGVGVRAQRFLASLGRVDYTQPDAKEVVMPSRRCPHCGKVAAYNPDNNTRRQFSRRPSTHARLDICQNDECGCATVAILDENLTKVLETYPPLAEAPDKLLPNDVAVAFGEALKALREGIWNSSVVMCSRALDEATVELKAKGGSLFERIENLAETHRITPDLSEWAHTGRLAANLGRHGAEKEQGEKKWNDENDAKEIVEFSRWFFQYVYLLPKQLAERRGRVSPQAHSTEPAQATPPPSPGAQ